ncbi:MAG: hypothetical protein M1837_003654 [Sclerophora amabilis]|nr:MAG: hypothetical protein M1837_003654 [Sclerophora amabilis]
MSSRHSQKSDQRRFSRDGFVPLSGTNTRNDVTVDIPLAPVPSHGQTGMRAGDQPKSQYSQSSNPDESSNEKSGFFHRHQGRRRAPVTNEDRAKERGKYGEEAATVTTMGKIYDKILNFSIVTRYFLYVLPLAILIAVPIVVAATVNPKAVIGEVTVIRIFIWVEIVWLSVWIAKLFAQALPGIFEFLCGIVSSGTRKYALAIKALEIPISLAAWALVCLVTFKPVTTPPAPKPTNPKVPPPSNEKPWQGVLYHVLWAAFISSMVFLLEKMLVQLISISYHRKQFNGKIQESKHNIHLLSLLYDASRTLFPAYGNDFAEEDYIINDSITAGGSKSGGHQRSGSATPMRLLRDVGRVGDKITSAFGNIAHEITGKQVFNPNSAHSVVVEALEKNKSSEALAKRIWMSFVVEGRDALYEEDIVEVLGSQRHDEAVEAFAAIDRDGNGDISLDEIIMTVVDFGRERHSIANSMHDVDQAINVLDGLLCTVCFIIIVFIFVAFLNSNFTTTLATAGTALLSLSFVFAATAQEFLGSCIFLFVKHPYDVGDRVDIKNEQLVVEHISLLFCVFKRIDTHKTVQVPNIVLNSEWIENISRSKAMREEVRMFINFDTTLEDIQALKNEMQKFVLDKENSRDFQSDIDVEIVGIAEMNKLELRVEIRHKSNWSNETLRASRRSKFMCALVLAMRKVPIYGPGAGDAMLGDVSKPTYSVTISDAEAARNRDQFTAEKDAKRLIPTSAAEPRSSTEDSGTKGISSGNNYVGPKRYNSQLRSRDNVGPTSQPTTETFAVDALNIRNPTADAGRDSWDTYRKDMDIAAAAEEAHARSEAARRGADVEEVRGVLRRQSTRGRRKPAEGVSPVSPVSSSQQQMQVVAESRPSTSTTGSNVVHPPPTIQTPTWPPRAENGSLPPGLSPEQVRPYQPYTQPPSGPPPAPPLSAHPAVRYQSPQPPAPAATRGNASSPGSPHRLPPQGNAFAAAERVQATRQQSPQGSQPGQGQQQRRS